MSITSIRSAENLHGRAGYATGSYLTDGCRLFRVVSQFATGSRRRFASLEDCLTLEVEAYSPGELEAMALRPVNAAE